MKIKLSTKIKLGGMFLIFGLLLSAQTTHAQALTFAADTTLTGDWDDYTTLTVASGSNATSLAVSETTITVTVAAGDIFTLNSSGYKNLSNNQNLPQNCNTPPTSGITIAGPRTDVVITPIDGSCPASGSSSRGGSSGGGSGGGVALACKDPVAVQNLRGLHQEGSNQLLWDSVSNNNSTRKYRVYRVPALVDSFDGMQNYANISAASTTYLDDAINASADYSYGIRVYETLTSACGERSADSGIVQVSSSTEAGTVVESTAAKEPSEETPEPAQEEATPKTTSVSKNFRLSTPVTAKEAVAEAVDLFRDIKSTNAYAEAVGVLVKNNIISGNPDGTVQVHDPLNRAALAKMLAPHADPDGSYRSCSFKDVRRNDWFYPYVCQLVEDGVVDQKDNYRPGAVVNRAEAFKMAALSFDLEIPTTVRHLPFSDTPKGAWYTPYFSSMKEFGLTNSRWKKGQPDTQMKRGVMFDLIYQYMKMTAR